MTRTVAPLRFLADTNMESRVVDHMAKNGYDVKHIPDYDPEMSDEALVELAREEHRILLTNDKDFGELTFMQRKISAGIILLRVKGQSVAEKVRLMDKLLRDHQERLPGHFVVAAKKKIRFIPMGGV